MGTCVGTSVGTGAIVGVNVEGVVAATVDVGETSGDGFGVDVTSTMVVHEIRTIAATNRRAFRRFSSL